MSQMKTNPTHRVIITRHMRARSLVITIQHPSNSVSSPLIIAVGLIISPPYPPATIM